MSSGVDNATKSGGGSRSGPVAPRAGRRRDAQASRQALLDAAGALFDARGYDRTTLRDIGERAHVDPALVARYFGGKEGLYLASLRELSRSPLPRDPSALVASLVERAETRGLGPLGLAMVSPTLTDAMREHVDEVVRGRVLAPLEAELRERGVPDPELRSEVLLALTLGVVLMRANGTTPRLQAASLPEVLGAVEPLVAALGA